MPSPTRWRRFNQRGAPPPPKWENQKLNYWKQLIPLSDTIYKPKEGIHHLVFHVEDIHAEIKRLVKEGFNVLGEVKKGADNKLICFLHPKTTNGVLVELCQEANLE